VADLFFSYSAKDRERVRPIREALTEHGFEVFWDQHVPPGSDWDTWIKEQLAGARCAVVFWSLTSIVSDNVRHEATVAKEQGKLVPVMLDALRVGQFPMGLFNTQAARLIDWTGNDNDPEWLKLIIEIESKSMPAWAGRRVASLEAALRAESKRREGAEAKEDAAEQQLAQEINKHGPLRRERDHAQAEAAAALAQLTGLQEALAATKTENDALTMRVVSAGQRKVTIGTPWPLWLVLLVVIGAIGTGAGVTYLVQEASWQTRAADKARVLQGQIDELRARAQATNAAPTVPERRETEPQRAAVPARATDEGALPVQLGMGASRQPAETRTRPGEAPIPLGLGARRQPVETADGEAPVPLGLGARR
jgi:hypothetical protein